MNEYLDLMMRISGDLSANNVDEFIEEIRIKMVKDHFESLDDYTIVNMVNTITSYNNLKKIFKTKASLNSMIEKFMNAKINGAEPRIYWHNKGLLKEYPDFYNIYNFPSKQGALEDLKSVSILDYSLEIFKDFIDQTDDLWTGSTMAQIFHDMGDFTEEHFIIIADSERFDENQNLTLLRVFFSKSKDEFKNSSLFNKFMKQFINRLNKQHSLIMNDDAEYLLDPNMSLDLLKQIDTSVILSDKLMSKYIELSADQINSLHDDILSYMYLLTELDVFIPKKAKEVFIF